MALTREQHTAWAREYRRNQSPEVKERRRLRALARYHERRELDLPKMRAYAKHRYAVDRRVSLLDGAKRRAKLLNLPINITIDDIIIPDVCPVLGIPIIPGGKANNPHLPSLDRIVPTLGYVIGNIAVISLRANSLKRDATLAECKLLYEWMVKQSVS